MRWTRVRVSVVMSECLGVSTRVMRCLGSVVIGGGSDWERQQRAQLMDVAVLARLQWEG